MVEELHPGHDPVPDFGLTGLFISQIPFVDYDHETFICFLDEAGVSESLYKAVSLTLSGKEMIQEDEEEQPEEKKPEPAVAPPPPVQEKKAPIEFGELAPPSNDQSFEEKLKKFMQASDSKNADKRRNTERKQHARRK